jgi:hypothetical protein
VVFNVSTKLFLLVKNSNARESDSTGESFVEDYGASNEENSPESDTEDVSGTAEAGYTLATSASFPTEAIPAG